MVKLFQDGGCVADLEKFGSRSSTNGKTAPIHHHTFEVLAEVVWDSRHNSPASSKVSIC